MARQATEQRTTRETDISITVHLDQSEPVDVDTSLPFLDHMLHALACHGRLGLEISARGDTQVDPHHLVEDCGIVLGRALRTALGDFGGIVRCGFFLFPMDGSLARVVLDLCGRPNLVWRAELTGELLGGVQTRLFRDFFKALADTLQATVHMELLSSDGDHHAVEALFKAFGRALRAAVQPATGVMSTKGTLHA
jgi:imidazoleglycerol-phosphate dehydratase